MKKNKTTYEEQVAIINRARSFRKVKEDKALENIHIRTTSDKKKKFQKVCEMNKTRPGTIINKWIDEYINKEKE